MPFGTRKRIAAAAILLVLGACRAAAAHDFWIQPNTFWPAPGETTTLTLEVGHGPSRQRSPIPLSRILRFESIGPGQVRADLRPLLHLGLGADDGSFRSAQGEYVLVLQTDERARSVLPAIRFNDYLRVEGLTPALVQRARTRQTDADGSEAYSRVAKVLMHVSAAPSRSSTVTEPVGLALEIVPETDPYANPRPSTLPVRVLYRGLPLEGASVKLTDLRHDASPIEMHVTDRAGRASFVMPPSGEWLLNVIWTRVAPPSSDADFETTFSSLTFGLP